MLRSRLKMEKCRMKMKERLNIIVHEVQEKGQIRVSELSELLGCSEVTIRNDIRKLDEQGRVKKTYGGAVKIESGLTVQFAPGEYYINGDQKRRIAEKAYEYIGDGESIMIDDSTTGCYLAQYIKEHSEKTVSVVTNSVYVAAELSTADHVRVYMLGGQISSHPASVMGNITVESASQYHVNKFFTGIRRIDLMVGMTSADAEHAEVKRMMMGKADETYVLADHTKFGNGSLFTMCTMEEVKRIITDREVADEILTLPRKLKIPMDVV